MTGATKDTVRIEVFRPGTFTPMNGNPVTYSAADLKAAADVYDKAMAPAPVVVGHPSTDAPAYAWAQGFAYDASAQRLYADVGEIDPAFAAAVRKGNYKKVSMSFHRPDSSANPVPGAWYPKHIGFLGGAAPAVTGLRNVQFGADDGIVTFTADVTFSTEFGAATVPLIGGNPDPAFAAREAAFAAQEAEFAARVAAFEAEKAELQAQARKAVTIDNAAFAERLISEGRLLPMHKGRVVSILDAAAESPTVSFAEGEQPVAMLEALRGVLEEQPKVVSFGHFDLGDDPHLNPPKSVAVPEGYSVDPGQSDLYNRAREIERQKGVSFADAVDIATGESAPRPQAKRRGR